MKVLGALCCLLLAATFVHSSPIVKREVEAEDDLSPLNEVYVVESDDDQAVDGDRGDRDKRKIGVIKLGVSNGIINFVFGKLDAFLDAKTKALTVLDESNKAKNAAFGIDNTQSATGQFINSLVSQKVKAATGSIGPLINSATTFLSTAKNGLTGAFVSKFAPLSSLAGSFAGGLSGGSGTGDTSGGAPTGSGSNGANLISGLISTKINALSGLSGSSGGLSAGVGGTTGSGGASISNSASASTGAGAGINLGAFANLAGGGGITTTTEDIPVFDRMKVSLDIPPPAFGAGFTLVNGVSKVLSSVILNSAKRTQTVLEVFKPFFRGTFAIKGLPSDNPQ